MQNLNELTDEILKSLSEELAKEIDKNIAEGLANLLKIDKLKSVNKVWVRKNKIKKIKKTINERI